MTDAYPPFRLDLGGDDPAHVSLPGPADGTAGGTAGGTPDPGATPSPS
jgi:hypothetical protein